MPFRETTYGRIQKYIGGSAVERSDVWKKAKSENQVCMHEKLKDHGQDNKTDAK